MTELAPNRPMSPLPEDCVDRVSFARALERLRDRKGLSPRSIVEACGDKKYSVGRSTIYNWFKDKVPQPGSEQAFREVLRMLGVTEQADQDAWLEAARNLRRRTASTGGEPFRGLKSYDVADAKIFCGRKKLTERVLSEVDALHSLDGGVVLLAGASGTGKSSLLKAGVIPALTARRLDGSDGWPILFTSAGPNPVTKLAEAIAAHLHVDADTIAADLGRGPAAIEGVLRRIVAMSTGSRSDVPASETAVDAKVLMVVDQFEQTMISAADGSGEDDALESFIAVLRVMMSGPVAVAVILGVRLDFLDAAMRRSSLRELTKDREPLFVGPMDENELTEVITQPALSFGVRIDPGFVELVLRDISARDGRAAHQAGTLPLLSHALHMTWQRGGKKRMTAENYHDVGGVDGAVSESAETTFARLSPAQQAVARRMFFCLVHLHPSGADTRRQVPLYELFEDVSGDGGELDVVLEQFVDQRLLTIDEDTVEITHEALMVAWPQLQEWLNSDRDGWLVAQKLHADARVWDGNGRPASDVYRGTRLQAARDWRDNHPTDTSELSHAFLDAAIRHSRRATRRRELTIAALTVLLVVAVILALTVRGQAQTLERQRDEAQSRSLASQVSALRHKDVAVARQLALAAYRISPTTEARSALIDATAQRPAVRMRSGAGSMYAVGMHPHSAIAAAATETTVLFWDITDPGHPKQRPGLPDATCSKIYALTFSPNGNLLAASCADGTIRLWDTRDPMAPVALPKLTDLGAKVYSVAFSPDSSMLAAAIAEPRMNDIVPGSVRLWTINGVQPQPLGGALRVDDNAPAKSVAFHPRNKQLAVGTDDGTVQLWDISAPARPANPVVTASGPKKAIGQLAFSPDGTVLAAGSADFQVHLWSTVDPRKPTPAGPPIDGSGWINAIAFSSDNATLAIASSDADNGLRLLELASRRVTATMPHPSPVTSVKFGPGNTSVITGANDGTARIWPVASPTLEGMDYTVSATRFSPDGTTLAIGSRDLRLLDVTNPQRPTPLGLALRNPDNFSGTLAFSPNNRLLAEGRGKSGSVQIWDLTDRSKPIPLGSPLQAHSHQVETIAFNRDSTLLATGSRDGSVRLWDVRTPEAPVLLSTPGTFGGAVHEVAFSPDNQFLVAGSADKTVRLWSISKPQNPAPVGSPLTPANHYVYSTLFSPDGTMLAVSLADSTIRLYDITDPTQPKPIGAPLTGPDNYVYSLSYTTDGTTLAAAASDGTLWIWDLHHRDAPAVYAKLTLSTGALFPVHYQPHTRLLVTGSDRKKAWLWNTDTEAAAALVCQTSGDSITPEEWSKYVPDRVYTPPCR